MQGSEETKVEVTSGYRINPYDHLMAAGLDVHDGGGLYLDLDNPAELITFNEIRQLPPGCFTAVSYLSCFADAPAPNDPRPGDPAGIS